MSDATIAARDEEPGAGTMGRYLAFELGGEEYAIEVERVEVVLETVPITRVPNAPAHLRGVINYRGAVIPVADLKTRFGEGRTAAVEGSSVIVLHIRYGGEDLVVGILADGVREVIDLERSSIERPPQMGARVDDALIAGIGEQGGKFIVVLDIDEAFKAEAGPARRAAEERAEAR
jgi:purine-binding chemotaxis protein CheW